MGWFLRDPLCGSIIADFFPGEGWCLGVITYLAPNGMAYNGTFWDGNHRICASDLDLHLIKTLTNPEHLNTLTVDKQLIN